MYLFYVSMWELINFSSGLKIVVYYLLFVSVSVEFSFKGYYVFGIYCGIWKVILQFYDKSECFEYIFSCFCWFFLVFCRVLCGSSFSVNGRVIKTTFFTYSLLKSKIVYHIIHCALELGGRGRFIFVCLGSNAHYGQWPLLLTWINFNPNMELHPL